MKKLVANYFSNIFTSSAGPRTNELLQNVDHLVTPEMNSVLLREFTTEEVKEAPTVFYKNYWELVGESQVRFCKS